MARKIMHNQIQRQWLSVVALLAYISMMGIVLGDPTRRSLLRSMNNNNEPTGNSRTAAGGINDGDGSANRIRSILDYGGKLLPDVSFSFFCLSLSLPAFDSSCSLNKLAFMTTIVPNQ